MIHHKRLFTKGALLLLLLTLFAGAGASDAPALIPAHLLRGEMSALATAEPFRSVPDQTPFTGADGSRLTLESLNGNWRLVNLWATWCAPCREEMPALDRLAHTYSDAPFSVVTIASGHHAPGEIERFMDQAGIRLLPSYHSPESAIARGLAVLGLPTSVLIDPSGREVARLTGSADWFSEEARAIIDHLLALETPPR